MQCRYRGRVVKAEARIVTAFPKYTKPRSNFQGRGRWKKQVRGQPETGNTDGEGTQEIYIWNKIERLGIYSLERRRLRGDLIETFKILTGRERIDSSKFFELSETTSGLRGHSLKLYKQHQLICSKTVWTSIGKIWASTADWLRAGKKPRFFGNFFKVFRFL